MSGANSLRAIAPVLGVSRSTVHRDTRTPVSDETRVRRVTGLDGKTYPASKDSLNRYVGAALTMLDQGQSVEQVAALIEVSPRTVRRWRSKWTLSGQVSESGQVAG